VPALAVALAVCALAGSLFAADAAAYPSTQRPLNACDFVADRVGWAVGDRQVVLRTVTGGALWSRQRSQAPPAPTLLDVCFADRSRGWVVGEHGVVLATADSGATWSPHAPVASVDWRAVCWAAGQTVLAAGSLDGLETSVLLRSADGGSGWTQIAAVAGGRLEDVCFADGSRGWAVGSRAAPYGRAGARSPLVLSTADGGQSWQEIPVAAVGLDPLAAVELYAVATAGAGDVWCAGRAVGAAGARGLLLRSPDGGSTWTATASSTFTSFRDVCFSGRSRGWVVGTGAGATLMATQNAGATWRRRRLPVGSRAAAVDFVDGRRGWIVGDTAKHKGLVARTRDGGTTWVRVR
jgi:photosystem II stability/assembly factor-like uncharacterized protein